MASLPVVTADVLLRLVGPAGQDILVEADLHYEPEDPYAVSICFRTGAGPEDVVVWTFARQLLTDGVVAPVGEGDIRIWPSRDGERVVNLAISSPDGSATFQAPLMAIVEFLSATYSAVPSGAEADLIDMDATIARLLHGSN